MKEYWTISEFNRERALADDLNLLKRVDVRYYELSKRQGLLNNIIIVLPKNKNTAKFVSKNNLREFDDYIWECYFGKKIVVLYGNCHMLNLAEVLKKSQPFLDKYVIYPIKPVCNIENKNYFDLPIFANCDILVHQSIWEKNRYGREFASANVISKTKQDCTVIAVPNVYHLPMCFYPQYIEKKELKRINGNTIFFRDRIVEDCVHEGKSISEIVRVYENEIGLFSEEELQDKWDKFIYTVRKREKEWDIKISDFIYSNKEKKLFYDPNHPSEIIIKYIGKELLSMLEITDEFSNDYTIPTMDTYEMPLCRDVVNKFLLDYDLKNYELRKNGSKIIFNSMYIEEYVKQYVCMLWQDDNYTLLFRINCFMNFCKHTVIEYIYKIYRRVRKYSKN